MKTMFLAFAAIAISAVIANVALNASGWSSAERQAASSVRLD